FDAVLARHAIGFAGPIDHLAITCLDRVAPLADRSIVTRYHTPLADLEHEIAAAVPVATRVDDVGDAIASALGRPIDVRSWGPRARDKQTA
ncbi:MAG TPA: hypothetical protein VK427_02060, partial [Kofleriaceae bacterium]|nr:hypothetical protein [Kofleriaceae bacterium]